MIILILKETTVTVALIMIIKILMIIVIKVWLKLYFTHSSFLKLAYVLFIIMSKWIGSA